MSRVFSRRPGRRFPLVPALGFVGGRGPSLIVQGDVENASRSRRSARNPQESSQARSHRAALLLPYDAGELVRGSPPTDAKRQRVDDSTPAETAKFLRMLKTREQIRLTPTPRPYAPEPGPGVLHDG